MKIPPPPPTRTGGGGGGGEGRKGKRERGGRKMWGAENMHLRIEEGITIIGEGSLEKNKYSGDNRRLANVYKRAGEKLICSGRSATGNRKNT